MAADNFGGSVYTFGVTDFSATTVAYSLVSDIYFRPITVTPNGLNIEFQAQDNGGVIYHLLLDTGVSNTGFMPILSGGTIQITGTTVTNLTGVSIGSTGILGASLPSGIFANTLLIKNTTTGLSIPVVGEVFLSDPNIGLLTKPCALISDTQVIIVPTPSNTTDHYQIQAISGPASLQATLLVHLSTSDQTQTPVFRGASLEEQ